MIEDMEILPVGYSTKIRKKRIGPFLVVIVFVSLALSVYFLITEYKDYKNISALLNDEDIEKTKESKIEISDKDQIKKNVEWGVTDRNGSDSKQKAGNKSDINAENITAVGIDTNVINEDADIDKKIEDLAGIKKEDTVSLKKEVQTEANNKYHIIVSSVDSKEAADRQQEKFKELSLNTSVIHVPKENRYRISLGSYTNMKEATNASKKFQSKYPNYKTWIWKIL